MSEPVYNPGQPYLHQINGGFTPGRIAHVTGTFSQNATSIVIKFQTGPYGDPTDEIGLCLYGRFSEKILGCNALARQTGWGQEEAKPTHHLVPGQQFDITILCDPMAFKIAVNREHFTEFNHRFDPARISHLNITSGISDLQLGCIWIEGGQAMNSNPSYGPGPNYSAPHSQQYGNDHMGGHSGKNKGLMGMVGSAGAAVAGALGASSLLGKSKGYGAPSGYPGGYGHGSGYPKSSHGGGMVNKALGIGGGLLAAKTAKKGLGGLGGLGGGKALKYGVPLAGAGLGGYMLTKGLSGSFSGGSSDEECCGYGSDSFDFDSD